MGLLFIIFLRHRAASHRQVVQLFASFVVRIIGLVDTVGLKLVLEEAEETLLSPDVALSVKPADGTNFQETIFSILSPDDVQVWYENSSLHLFESFIAAFGLML